MNEIDSTPRKQQVNPAEPTQLSSWLAAGKLLLVALLVLLIVNGLTQTFILTPVNGSSMEPTYSHGDLLVMYSHKAPDTYERGDIVVVELACDTSDGKGLFHSAPLLIKRVIGVPGDIISYNPDTNTLYINGTPYDEPYLAEDSITSGFEWSLGEYLVPKNSLFVMGDNRNASGDSRLYGPFSYDDIRGSILFA